jgi:hypothetical protein
MNTKQRSTGNHPLGSIVVEMAKRGEMLDVTTVSCALSGAAFFIGRHSKKGMNAYRIVAADVLGCLADCGVLHQNKPFRAKPEDGGPYFVLADQ